jgi:hypothetical protein
MACVNSSSLPETTRSLGLGRSLEMIRAPQFRNLVSIYNFSALHFMVAGSITLLAWFP